MKLTQRDLVMIRDLATKSFNGIPMNAKLNGMERSLNSQEQMALAYFESVLTVLNHNGAIKPEFLDTNPVQLENEDSDKADED